MKSKQETAMNNKDINIEEWRRAKEALKTELTSRNLTIPSFGKKNMANFIIYLLHRIDCLEGNERGGTAATPATTRSPWRPPPSTISTDAQTLLNQFWELMDQAHDLPLDRSVEAKLLDRF